MVKWQTPKKVTLPNGTTFYARYKWGTRANLLANIRFGWPYKKRAASKERRRWARQGGRGFKSALVNWWDLLKKVENNKAFKRVAGAVLKEVPAAIGNLSKRVKNKKLKSILYSDMTKTGVDLATGYALDKLNN